MAFRGPNAKVLALVAAASPEVRALFEKQEPFTLDESRFLKEWIVGVLEGRADLAERLVDHGLRLEHFKSVLDPNESRPDAIAIRDALAEENEIHRKEFANRNQVEQEEEPNFDDVSDGNRRNQ